MLDSKPDLNANLQSDIVEPILKPRQKSVELLSPAGSLHKLKTVIRYGADAVFLGGKTFNLRAKSHNFNKEELKEAVDYCHSMGKKAFVTLNILAHNREITALPQFVKYLEQISVDAVIVADMGVLDLVRENSDLPIHISTQASTTNYRTVKMWKALGAKRVVLARELSLNEISKIKNEVPDMELEVFVHGAMCMTYSGRCQLSSFFADRDGNRGACTNTCRWKFAVVEEKRPGEYFPVYEDENGATMFNSKDLCTVGFLDQIIATGVDSLKIEGRMKSLLYGATTAKVYREAIDAYYAGTFHQENNRQKELESFSHRGYTPGFYFGKLDANATRFEGGYDMSHEMVGYVQDVQEEDGTCTIELLNRLTKGGLLEFIKPNGDVVKHQVEEMINTKNGEIVSEAHSNTIIQISLPKGVEAMDVIRQPIL